jgi:hypothetical protein
VAVLSPLDNQIVTLSAKSPNFIKSGCTLRSSREASRESSTTTAKPPKKTTEEYDSTYFDQFLKPSPVTSTEQSSTTEFLTNFTDVGLEDFASASPDFKNMVFDQEAQDNNIENSTDFKLDVEELFDKNDSSENRTKRQIFTRSYEDRKQTIYVSCHNAGGFTSARQRWWYIAL